MSKGLEGIENVIKGALRTRLEEIVADELRWTVAEFKTKIEKRLRDAVPALVEEFLNVFLVNNIPTDQTEVTVRINQAALTAIAAGTSHLPTAPKEGGIQVDKSDPHHIKEAKRHVLGIGEKE